MRGRCGAGGGVTFVDVQCFLNGGEVIVFDDSTYERKEGRKHLMYVTDTRYHTPLVTDSQSLVSQQPIDYMYMKGRLID